MVITTGTQSQIELEENGLTKEILIENFEGLIDNTKEFTLNNNIVVIRQQQELFSNDSFYVTILDNKRSEIVSEKIIFLLTMINGTYVEESVESFFI